MARPQPYTFVTKAGASPLSKRSPMRSLRSLLLALAALAASLPAAAGAPRLLKDLNPERAAASSNPSFLGRLGSRAIFLASDAGIDEEPWVSDETEGGTHRLADLCPGTCSSRAQPFGQSRRAVLLRR